MSKVYQICATFENDGAAIVYARRDDGRIFRYVDVIGGHKTARTTGWHELPPVPGCSGDNGNPDDDDGRSPRRRY